MSRTTALLPFQPTEMSPAQLAAVSYLARYSGHTHRLYESPWVSFRLISQDVNDGQVHERDA